MSRPNRVTSKHPCKICGEPNWCYTLGSESDPWKAFCMNRTDGARFVNPSDGAGVYLLGDVQHNYEVVEAPLVASTQRCNDVYTDLLKLCDPIEAGYWYKNLTDRGFLDDEIATVNYRLTPENGDRTARKLLSLGHTLDNVPGFYMRGGEWTMKTPARTGFFIPIVSDDQKIRRLQIRTTMKDAKYIWLSSDIDKEEEGELGASSGASSGAPVHFRLGDSTTLYINEAPLKTDYMFYKTGQTRSCIGSAGVTSGQEEIADETLNPHYNRAVICFDGNWRSNVQVAKALARLYRRIQNTSGLDTTVGVWASECGIDDAMKARLRFYESSYDRWFANIPEEFRKKIKEEEKNAEKVIDYA